MFPYSHRNTIGSLGEREIASTQCVGTWARRASVSSQFRVLPITFTGVSITYGSTGGNAFYFFYKITRKNLRGNSLLYQSVNSPYRSWWRMCDGVSEWREPFHVFHTVIETRLLAKQISITFSKCYHIKHSKWYLVLGELIPATKRWNRMMQSCNSLYRFRYFTYSGYNIL